MLRPHDPLGALDEPIHVPSEHLLVGRQRRPPGADPLEVRRRLVVEHDRGLELQRLEVRGQRPDDGHGHRDPQLEPGDGEQRAEAAEPEHQPAQGLHLALTLPHGLPVERDLVVDPEPDVVATHRADSSRRPGRRSRVAAGSSAWPPVSMAARLTSVSIRAFIVELTAAASFTSRGVRRVSSGA